ncbi:host attachment protein [Rubrivivax gelatinosus]|uniref:Host attachment protein n=1 Tax=Rubrivivax gelatinosus TaxID=28068 RepID=A0ABS1E1F2_RUBGE|nr:host attachment protein [Rubrivivax gelatinosus]MBK1715231.1 host attachment protein [Rubrivivax gelatinosus]
MNKTVWVVVADEAIARFLQRPDEGGALQPVEELTDPAAHARGQDLRADATGRRAGGSAAGASRATGATTSAGTDEKHHEADGFARRVAARLHEALLARRFDELHLAAAPRFLGLLRKALSPQVSRCLGQQLDKDLVQVDNAALAERFFPRPRRPDGTPM